jgi:hypothetical protein
MLQKISKIAALYPIITGNKSACRRSAHALIARGDEVIE